MKNCTHILTLHATESLYQLVKMLSARLCKTDIYWTINFMFSEMLRQSKGRYTPDQINRVATMSGVLGGIIHDELCRAIGTTTNPAHREYSDAYEQDLRTYLENVKDHHLFAYEPARQHQGFDAFRQHKETQIERLANKILSHSKDLDFWRRQKLRLVHRQHQQI